VGGIVGTHFYRIIEKGGLDSTEREEILKDEEVGMLRKRRRDLYWIAK